MTIPAVVIAGPVRTRRFTFFVTVTVLITALPIHAAAAKKVIIDYDQEQITP